MERPPPALAAESGVNGSGSVRAQSALAALPGSKQKTDATEKQECMPGNQITLAVAAGLFALITVVQYVFALIANSLALQADCVSMGVDSLTYLASLAVECSSSSDAHEKRGRELAMAGVSYTILMSFTIKFMVDGAAAIKDSDDDDSVNGYIVMGFAVGGLVFDFASLIVFRTYGEHTGILEDVEEAHEEVEEEEPVEGVGVVAAHSRLNPCGINANMCAALLHIISDLLRSVTTLIESIVILLAPSINSAQADGVSTLIVCSIILVGVLAAMATWIRALRVHWAAEATGRESASGLVNPSSDNSV